MAADGSRGQRAGSCLGLPEARAWLSHDRRGRGEEGRRHQRGRPWPPGRPAWTTCAARSPRLAQRCLLSPRPPVCSGPSEGRENVAGAPESRPSASWPVASLAAWWPCHGLPAQAPRGPAGHTLGQARCSQHRCRNRRGLTRGRWVGRSFSHTPCPGPEGNGAPGSSGASSLGPDSALSPPSCWAWHGSGRGPRIPSAPRHPPAGRVPRSSTADPQVRHDSAPVGEGPPLHPLPQLARGGHAGQERPSAPTSRAREQAVHQHHTGQLPWPSVRKWPPPGPPKPWHPHARELRRCAPGLTSRRALWSGVGEGHRVRPPARGSGIKAGPHPWVALAVAILVSHPRVCSWPDRLGPARAWQGHRAASRATITSPSPHPIPQLGVLTWDRKALGAFGVTGPAPTPARNEPRPFTCCTQRPRQPMPACWTAPRRPLQALP